MGKKRRILTRTTKFAKKYFEFLDQIDETSNVIDATEDDDIIEVGDPFIDTVTVTDLNNQTVTVAGTAIGLKAGDKVEFSVDGEAFGSEKAVTASGSGIGRIEFTQTVNAADNNGHSVGSHTFTVRKKNATDPALRQSAKANVRQNKIVLGLAANCFVDDGDNNINFDATKVSLTSGKKQAGSGTNAVLGTGAAAAIGIKIEIFHNGVAQTIVDKDGGNAATSQAVGKGVTFNAGQAIEPILQTDMDQAGQVAENVAVDELVTFVARVTPVDASDTVLDQSAIEQTFTVTRKA